MFFLRSRTAVPVAACLVLGLAVGCQAILGIDDTSFQSGDGGSDDGSTATDASLDGLAPSDSATDAPSSTPTVAFAPPRVFINEGGEVDVTVNLTRNGFSGGVTLALASVGDAGITVDGGDDGGGADGISAASLTIPAGSNTGTLHLFASSTAAIGSTMLDFTLTADTPSPATLPAIIGGAPGSSDTAFGINGVAAAVSGYQPAGVAIGDDDSIWLVNGTWKVLHYFSNGTSDDTLNTKLATTLGSPSGTSTRIAVSGSVVLICGNDGTSPTLRKLTTGGDYDPTFASAGIFQPKVSSNIANGNFTGVAFSPTGDILLSGTFTGPLQNLGGVILRDSSGVQTLFVIGTPFTPVGVGADSSGHIGAGGLHTTADGGSNLFGQIIDTAFHDAGLLTGGDVADDYTAQQAIVTPASAIAVAGTRNHFLPSGGLGAFSTDASTDYFLAQDHVGTWDQGYNAIASRADGKVYVTDENGGSTFEEGYIARYNTDGGLDSSWSAAAHGVMTSPFITFYGLDVDSVGRVVAAGTADSNLYLMRVWP